MAKRKLRPVLDGDWWLIGPSPDLRGILPGAEQHLAAWEDNDKKGEHNAPVDHHIFRSPDGKWQLWGCVRATAVGRILYRWEADELTDSPWRCTGEIIRCDRQAGECLNDRTSEQIQSPFFVQQNGLYYLFYGDASDKLVGTLAVGAPELYEVGGQDYVSSNHEPQLGTQMCRLQWVEE